MIGRDLGPSGPTQPSGCNDIDLDALAYRELSPVDELIARNHLAACASCQREHDKLLAERSLFAARARNSRPDPLPSFDQVIARATVEPSSLATRWRSLVESWSTPWRGAVLQGAVGMFAVGMLVQVAILRPRATETPRSRPAATASVQGQNLAVDPWGVSIAEGAECDAEVQVCEDVALASAHTAPAVSDPCAGAPQAPASVDWSLQPSTGLDSADAVCAADAI